MSQVTDKSETEAPNRLVPLKVLIFLFFGALQCLYAYLPHHMSYLGFTRDDIRTITMIASLVSIIGPLIVGFIMDRVSLNRSSAYGKYLRVLLFISFICAGLLFGSLLFVTPADNKVDDNEPSVTFSCDSNGGHLFQKRCGHNEPCYDLIGQTGSLALYNCSYTCEKPENFKYLYSPYPELRQTASERLVDQPINSSEANVLSGEDDYDENKSYAEADQPHAEPITELKSVVHIKPPHICVNNGTQVHCHVSLEGKLIELKHVEGVAPHENDNNTFSDEWCKHPLAKFECHVPEKQVTWMRFLLHKDNINHCAPAIECLVKDINKPGSILENKSCFRAVPYIQYTILRIFAEIFPVIIHLLLNIAIIIGTRETSVGRGNVGHQWAFYPIGVLVFSSVLGIINHACTTADATDASDRFLIAMIVFPITMFVAAIIVLFSGKLPLTPSDWWWHTKCGMLAIPMSALKRYKWVITAIAVVTFILGGLWHIQEGFRHIFSIDIIEAEIIDYPQWCSKTFVYVIGALLAIPIIWNGEKIVDLMGHSNIFILAFLSFAFRFGGLYSDNETSWSTLFEILEPISFYLAWLALLLFIRHLVPKKFLAIGQALLVLLFFSVGRAVGFYFGVSDATTKSKILDDLKCIHGTAATIACAVALIYFVIYHLILLPCYRVPTNRLNANNDSSVSPQRVFHDERSRKGYFRY